MVIAQIIVYLFLAYAVAGILFAMYFSIHGVTLIDETAKDSGIGFRLMIIPGVAALWVVLLPRLLTGARQSVEKNAHRSAARGEGE